MILYLFLIVLVHSAFGAENEQTFLGKKITSKPQRAFHCRYMDFNKDADKLGHFIKSKRQKTLAEDARFLAILEREKTMDFGRVAREASAIYTQDFWPKVFNLLYDRRDIGVDLKNKRLVLGRPAVAQPEERIEVAMARIFEDDTMTTRYDLILMLYAEGYRDYCYRAIAAKESVLVVGCFINKRQIYAGSNGSFIDRMSDYWKKIMHSSEERSKELYLSVDAEDTDRVYQMIYMHKYGILGALGRFVMCNNVAPLGYARYRQQNILRYINQHGHEPFPLHDLAEHVNHTYTASRGILWDLANLVFLGKVKLFYDFKRNTCMLDTEAGCSQERCDDDCDELVFFKNLHKHHVFEYAVLATYKQGYTAYSPKKLLLYKKAFQHMELKPCAVHDTPPKLASVLEEKAYIPPTWEWGKALTQKHLEALCVYGCKDLDAIFEMHNRGVFEKIRAFIHSLEQAPKEVKRLRVDVIKSSVRELFVEESALGLLEAKNRLCELGRKEEIGWTEMIHFVYRFSGHLSYDEHEDQVTWSDAPMPRVYTDDQAIEVACMLRNYYPSIGMDTMCFLLALHGFDVTPHNARVIFYALDIAGFVQASKEKPSPYVAECRKFFAHLHAKVCAGQGVPEFDSCTGIGQREYKSAAMALAMSSDVTLAKVAQNTTALRRMPKKKFKSNSQEILEIFEQEGDLSDCESVGEASSSRVDVRQEEGALCGLDALCRAAEHVEKKTLEKTCNERQLAQQKLGKRHRDFA